MPRSVLTKLKRHNLAKTASNAYGKSAIPTNAMLLHPKNGLVQLCLYNSSCMCINNHNWPANQQLHCQRSVVETSCHLTSTEDQRVDNVGQSLDLKTGTEISGCLIPFLLAAGTTVTMCSPKMVKQRPSLSWKIEK